MVRLRVTKLINGNTKFKSLFYYIKTIGVNLYKVRTRFGTSLCKSREKIGNINVNRMLVVMRVQITTVFGIRNEHSLWYIHRVRLQYALTCITHSSWIRVYSSMENSMSSSTFTVSLSCTKSANRASSRKWTTLYHISF